MDNQFLVREQLKQQEWLHLIQSAYALDVHSALSLLSKQITQFLEQDAMAYERRKNGGEQAVDPNNLFVYLNQTNQEGQPADLTPNIETEA